MIAIISTQRTGSTQLGVAFAQSIGGPALGEIFHDGSVADGMEKLHLEPRALFSEHVKYLASQDPVLLGNLFLSPKRMLDRYITKLANVFGRNHTLLVKYNGLMAFNTGWRRLTAQNSEILDALVRHGYRIIHLKRRNALAGVLSEIIAFRIKQWHHVGDAPADRAAPRIMVLPRLCAERMEFLKKEEDAAHGLVDRVPHETLVYETDILPDSGAAACARLLGPLSGTTLVGEGSLRRTPRVIVENIEEVCQFCRSYCLPEDLEEIMRRYGPVSTDASPGKESVTYFSLLKSRNFNAYRNRRSGQSQSVVFVHVPKTAGSTIARTFRLHGLDFLRVEIDYSDPAEIANYHDAMRRRLAEAVARPITDRGRFITGHYFMRDVLKVTGGLDNRQVFTMLRDPVTRIISEYQYSRSPRHPPREAFKARFPTLTHYLNDPSSREQILEFLRPSDTATAEETIAFLESNLALVGIQEQFELSMELLHLATGVNCVTEDRQNALEADQEGEREELLSFRQQIEASNPNDMKIYTWFSAMLKDLKEPFETWKHAND